MVKGGPGDRVRRLPEGEGGGKPPRFQRFIEIDNTLFKHAWLPEVTGGFKGLTAGAADPGSPIMVDRGRDTKASPV